MPSVVLKLKKLTLAERLKVAETLEQQAIAIRVWIDAETRPKPGKLSAEQREISERPSALNGFREILNLLLDSDVAAPLHCRAFVAIRAHLIHTACGLVKVLRPTKTLTCVRRVYNVRPLCLL